MRIVDIHVHTRSLQSAAELVRTMDATGVARTLVISEQERTSLARTREKILATKALFDAAPGRIGGLAWIEPTLPGAADLAEEALTKLGFTGIKIIPDHWFAYEERLAPFWKRMDSLGARILFHTGILYGNDDGSRFCHPEYLETLLHYPRIRFAMAHISWPWCEECLAVMGRMRAAVGYKNEGWQSYVDLTPGTPRHIRKQAVANAVEFCGAARIMFGTDCSTASIAGQKDHIARDLGIFKEIGLTDEQVQRIMAGTADELFPVR